MTVSVIHQVSCEVSFLLVLHADVHSEHYESFFVQAGVSASLLPSIFRFTEIFKKMIHSTIIDWTLLFLITGHLVCAGTTLFFIIAEQNQGREAVKVKLVSALLSISVGISICAAELVGLAVAATSSIRHRSSTLTPEESGEYYAARAYQISTGI